LYAGVFILLQAAVGVASLVVSLTCKFGTIRSNMDGEIFQSEKWNYILHKHLNSQTLTPTCP
jgi:hypothetical protein